MDLSDEKRVEAALKFLAGSDELIAQLKVGVARTEYLAKLQDAMAFRAATGNIEERKAEAKMMPAVQKTWEEHFVAIGEYEKVRAKRERAVLTCDLWRTAQASRRMGNV